MLLLVLNVGLYEWFGQRSKLISRHPKSIF
jgi:hypothetical protein